MEAYFSPIFEDVRHERSVNLLLSLVKPDILKQSKFTDHEIDIIKKIALEKKNIFLINERVHILNLRVNQSC